MQFAIDIPNFGIYSDPQLLAELAYEAEESGWDGFFIWDHINYKLTDSQETPMIGDPWIQLAAIAMRTKSLKLGPMVTPLPRRRPWKVAREAVTLDHLSDGRLILGIGLGSDRSREYSSFNEVADAKIHGEMLDEGLEVMTRLWSGKEVNYEGKHYQLSNIQFLPEPLQQPRIPLWIAGYWPNKKPFRRAAHWDGIFPLTGGKSMAPEDFREAIAYTQAQRTSKAPFDAIAGGLTSGTDKAKDMATVSLYTEAGANWWLETFTAHHTLEEVRQRIYQGPSKE